MGQVTKAESRKPWADKPVAGRHDRSTDKRPLDRRRRLNTVIRRGIANGLVDAGHISCGGDQFLNHLSADYRNELHIGHILEKYNGPPQWWNIHPAHARIHVDIHDDHNILIHFPITP
jgi:hypothetical protein